MKENFIWISPYSPEDNRGGWKAMQYYLLRALEKELGPAMRIPAIEVPEEFLAKWTSRALKQLHIPRPYASYSESRLVNYGRAVHAHLPADPKKPVVFFGALPFVKARPAGPYYIYTDGAFFIHYWEYNRDHSHRRADIHRICNADASFMEHSSRVWCSSKWVADRITQEYKLSAGKAIFVGTGGGAVPEPAEPLRWGDYLVMIEADFERKRGRLAVEAVAVARQMGANLSIKFIGAQPPPDLMRLPFVESCGWLDSRKEEDRRKFVNILSNAGAHILLSRVDLTPLAVTEASTFSKATLATRVGGIPEMIQDGRTGWLVDADADSIQIGKRLYDIFTTPETRERVGEASQTYCQERWSWNGVAAAAVESMLEPSAQPELLHAL